MKISAEALQGKRDVLTSDLRGNDTAGGVQGEFVSAKEVLGTVIGYFKGRALADPRLLGVFVLVLVVGLVGLGGICGFVLCAKVSPVSGEVVMASPRAELGVDKSSADSDSEESQTMETGGDEGLQIAHAEVEVPGEFYVDVSGAVDTPGVYRVSRGSIIADVIDLAGGLSSKANKTWVAQAFNQSIALLPEQKIYIPAQYEVVCYEASVWEYLGKIAKEYEENSNTERDSKSKDNSEDSDDKEDKEDDDDNDDGDNNDDSDDLISINDASQEKLETLPGIGPATAEKIIEGRPYEELEDIKNVSGIGDATYDKIKDLIKL